MFGISVTLSVLLCVANHGIPCKMCALPFLGAGVVVFTLTRSASEAEEPTFCNVLARAL